MTVEPFRNEPIETFQTEEARRAMRDHLLGISSRLGLDASEDKNM